MLGQQSLTFLIDQHDLLPSLESARLVIISTSAGRKSGGMAILVSPNVEGKAILDMPQRGNAFFLRFGLPSFQSRSLQCLKDFAMLSVFEITVFHCLCRLVALEQLIVVGSVFQGVRVVTSCHPTRQHKRENRPTPKG